MPIDYRCSAVNYVLHKGARWRWINGLLCYDQNKSMEDITAKTQIGQ